MKFLPVSLTLLIALVGSCKDGKTVSPTDELSQTVQTEHFTFHVSPGDQVDTARQEAHYQWLVATLLVTVPQKLECFRYHDRDQIFRLTGRQTNGFAELATYKYHTIWSWDNHESVHCLVTSLIGWPPALFNEGFAVGLQTDPLSNRFTPMWNMIDLHVLAKQYLLEHSIPPLDTMLDSRTFFAYDPNMTYPVAGSFAEFLVSSRGMTPMKSFIAKASFYDTIQLTRDNFLEVYSEPLDTLWQQWQTFLITGN